VDCGQRGPRDGTDRQGALTRGATGETWVGYQAVAVFRGGL
jgi:hypothetical protein